KQGAQHHQVRDALEIDAEDRLRELGVLADRVIDDGFRQVERIIQKRKRGEGQQEQGDLLSQAVFQDETVDRRLEVADLGRGRFRGCRRLDGRPCFGQYS